MSTKYFDLFSALKAGGTKGVTPESLTKALNFSGASLAVYIHALRHKFGAQIESVRNGRTVVAYRLLNIAEMEKVISPNRKPRTVKAKKITKTARVVTTTPKKPTKSSRKTKTGILPVIEDTSITEIDTADLDDIKSQLGIA